MFSSSRLTDEQKAALRTWAEQGATMADLQRRLGEECGVRVTYMEMRFIVLDLGLALQEEVKESAKASLAATAGVPPQPTNPEPAPFPGGGVRVTIDQLAVPGTLASGKATFSDGQTALWYVDEMGRLGLDPDVAGYRPGKEDLVEFQRQLQAMLRKSGY